MGRSGRQNVIQSVTPNKSNDYHYISYSNSGNSGNSGCEGRSSSKRVVNVVVSGPVRTAPELEST